MFVSFKSPPNPNPISYANYWAQLTRQKIGRATFIKSTDIEIKRGISQVTISSRNCFAFFGYHGVCYNVYWICWVIEMLRFAPRKIVDESFRITSIAWEWFTSKFKNYSHFLHFPHSATKQMINVNKWKFSNLSHGNIYFCLPAYINSNGHISQPSNRPKSILLKWIEW